MVKISATLGGDPVPVSNGDAVSIADLAEGTVEIVAADSNVRNFRIDYGDSDSTSNRVIIDFDSFTRDNLQIQVIGYHTLDALQLDGATNIQIGVPKANEVTFEYGDGFTGIIKILDPGERDLLDKPPPLIICFAQGTIIDTELGPRPVDGLLVGDRIKTVDHGYQKLQWIGRRAMDASTLEQNPNLLPVRISAGAMGHGLPWTDLVVSPQHRIRVKGWRAELLFGYPEVLIPAKAFLSSPGVDVLDDWTGSYYHLLFDRHELLWSNGLITESLHPGEIALSALGNADREAVLGCSNGQTCNHDTCRPVMRVAEARAINLLAA